MRNLIFLLLAIMVSCQQSSLEEIVNNVSKEGDVSFQATRSISTRRGLQLNEMRYLKSIFPKMDVESVVVTGEATTDYNCIAYAMNIFDTWISPFSNLGSFVSQFENARTNYGGNFNYRVTNTHGHDAYIDGWGLGYSNMTHASRNHSNVDSESKLGSYLRITHKRDELEGSSYGKILVSFYPNSLYPTSASDTVIKLSKEAIERIHKEAQKYKIQLSSSEKQAVIEAASKVSIPTCERFHTLLTEWNNAIKSNPAMLISSDTKDYAKLPEFAKLKAMGKDIIPLIMKELLNENNFYLLPLYDAIQDDSLQRVVLDTNSTEILGGEQYRAKKTIQLWLKNNNK